MASKLLIAFTSLAIMAASFGPSPVSALATSGSGSIVARNHAHIARNLKSTPKRRTLGKRCQARTPPTATASASDSAPTSTADAAAANAGSDPNAANSASTAAPTDSGDSSGGDYGGDDNSGGDSGGAASTDAGTYSAPAATTSAAYTAPTGSSGGSSSGSTGGGKIGLAWANGDDPSLSNFVNSKVSYIYTWSPEIPAQAQSLGLEGIPMLWGSNQIDDFQRLVVQGYANIVLGFNEPNESGQSNLDPYTAAGLWQQYIQPLKSQGYKLISPACSSNPNGVTWTQTFMSACNGCTFDAVAVHWYDVSADAFISYIENYHNTFNLPIWVTEFACQNFNGGAQCTQDYIYQFMGQVTAYMDSADWVEAYFAFGIMHDMQGVNDANQLMGSDSEPTSLGWQYLSADN